MKSRALLGVAVLVALAVSVAFFVAPGLYSYPIENQSYGIAHESTEAFDTALEETALETEDITPKDELSGPTQRALEEPRTESGGSSGGWEEIAVTVCDEAVPLCPGYAVEPDFPESASRDPGCGLETGSESSKTAATRTSSRLGTAAAPASGCSTSFRPCGSHTSCTGCISLRLPSLISIPGHVGFWAVPHTG
ncbi:hypothetical protein [Halostagnicola bangensis]